MNVYIYTNDWIPNSNTYIYYPLKSDLVDVMGNGATGTMTGTCSFNEKTGITVTGKSGNYVTGMSVGINNRNRFTLNVWIKYDTFAYDGQNIIGYTADYPTSMAFKIEHWEANGGPSAAVYTSSDWSGCYDDVLPKDTKWHNVCLVADGTKYQWYFDGVKTSTSKITSNNVNNVSELQLGWGGYYGATRAANGKIRDYIVELFPWSDADVLNYYNQTKPDEEPWRDDYQEVEYIESTGGQYIDTGLTGNTKASWEIKMSPLSSYYTSYEMYCGGGSSRPPAGKMLRMSTQGPWLQYNSGEPSSVPGYAWEGAIFSQTNDVHVVSLSTDGIIVDGVKKSDCCTGPWGNGHFWLFANSGETSYKSSMRLYYFKAYSDGTLVRDYVPVYRKSDSVIGLYDKENDQFYTNAGSGSFTKGPDVN